MEITFKELLESDAYETQKGIIAREINWGDPKDAYIPYQIVFKHTIPEKPLLRNLQKKWREQMRAKWGKSWSKRNASRKCGEFHHRMN